MQLSFTSDFYVNASVTEATMEEARHRSSSRFSCLIINIITYSLCLHSPQPPATVDSISYLSLHTFLVEWAVALHRYGRSNRSRDE